MPNNGNDTVVIDWNQLPDETKMKFKECLQKYCECERNPHIDDACEKQVLSCLLRALWRMEE